MTGLSCFVQPEEGETEETSLWSFLTRRNRGADTDVSGDKGQDPRKCHEAVSGEILGKALSLKE